VPLKRLDVLEASAPAVYENYPLVLVRPDQHIAWRGFDVPSAPLEIVDRIRGAA
jgi:hypothetical protein